MANGSYFWFDDQSEMKYHCIFKWFPKPGSEDSIFGTTQAMQVF